jgi:hypothetical protein
MRVSVQLRGGRGASAGDRWIRSIYLDPAWREYTLAFADFVGAGTPHTPKPALPEIGSILLVVDLTNTRPGFTGTFSVQTAEVRQ